MEQFRGQLTRNGQVIIEHVEGRLDVETGPGGATFWTGYFAVPPGQSVEREEPFQQIPDFELRRGSGNDRHVVIDLGQAIDAFRAG